MYYVHENMEYIHFGIDTEKLSYYNEYMLTQGGTLMQNMQYVRICDEQENMEFVINRTANHKTRPLFIVEIGHSTPYCNKKAELVAKSYQLHYVVKGEMFYCDNKVSGGMGALISPGEAFKLSFDKGGAEHYWINFDGTEAKNLLHKSGLSEENNIFEYSKNKTNNNFLKQAFEGVFRADKNETPSPIQHTHSYLVGLLYQLLAINEMNKEAPTSLVDGYVETVCAYIRSHYLESITIKNLADTVGLSPKYLCRIFKNVTGCTLIEYLTDIRLEVACHLLLHTDKSISEIAISVGYSDALYFSKVFHATHKISPSKWRKEHI